MHIFSKIHSHTTFRDTTVSSACVAPT